MDTANIYRGNSNLEESIYDFLIAQQNKTKKLLDHEINFTGDFDSCINEIINPITDDRDDLHTPWRYNTCILIVRLNFYSIIIWCVI